MAKKSLRTTLFGDGPLVGELLHAVAGGFGVPGHSAAERQLAEQRRQAAIADQALAMQRNQIAAMQKAPAGTADNATGATPGLSFPGPDNELAAMLGGGQVTPSLAPPTMPQPPTLFGNGTDLMSGSPTQLSDPPMMPPGTPTQAPGMLPPPVRSPLDQMGDVVATYDKMPLNQEGKQGLIRLKQISDQAAKLDGRPGQQELIDQFQREASRLRLDDKVEIPPTIQSESEGRVIKHPNGMQEIMQGDGRIDVKDLTSKMDLEDKRQAHDMLKHEDQMRATMQAERQKIDAEQSQAKQEKTRIRQEAEAKVVADRKSRYADHRKAAAKDIPWEKRFAAAKDEITADFKANNPKTAIPEIPQQLIEATARAAVDRDFVQQEKDRDLADPITARKLSPEDALQKMFKDDPEQFRKDFKAKENELRDGDTKVVIDPSDVLTAMMNETDEALGGKLDEFVSTAKAAKQLAATGPSTAEVPIGQRPYPALPGNAPVTGDGTALVRSMFGGQRQSPAETSPMPSAGPASPPDTAAAIPVNPLREPIDQHLSDGKLDVAGYSDSVRQSLATQLGVKPDDVPQKEVDRHVAIPKLLANRDAGKADRKDGSKYIQNMNESQLDEIMGASSVITDKADWDAVAPGDTAINARTGEVVTKPVLHSKAAEIDNYNRQGSMLGLVPPVVQRTVAGTQAKIDSIPDGEYYVDGFSGRSRVKKKGDKIDAAGGSLYDAVSDYFTGKKSK